MDDQQNMALNESGEETAPTTPVEEQTTDQGQVTTYMVHDDPEQENGGSEKPQRKGISSRFSEVINRTKAVEETTKTLSEQIAELKNQVRLPVGLPPYNPLEPLVKPGEEVDYEEINRRQALRDQELLRRSAEINNYQTQQALALERIGREAEDAVERYSVLNRYSDDFDPELSETVSEAALAYARANPGKSLKAFVDKQMRVHNRAVTKEVTAEKANIAQQTAQTAIRPSTTKPVEKKFEDMSLAEMEAQLGFVE